MAKKVKFPLDMADGAQVRSMEDLREHFDIDSVLGYFADGQLTEWLEVRNYGDEAAKIKAMGEAPDLKSLCDILGVEYKEEYADQVDFTDISERNERLTKLKAITDNYDILKAVDSVAFTQEELTGLLDKGVTEIYLCGESFTIPGENGGVTYIGVNNPNVTVPDDFQSKGITFQGISDLDVDDIMRRVKDTNDESKKAKLWRMAAKLGNAEAQCNLGWCYEYGIGVEDNIVEAVKWYRKAAEQGNAEAQYELGKCYCFGEGVKENKEQAEMWFRKSAEQGNPKAENRLKYV